MKIVLSRILLNYEMKFPKGQGRPRNMKILELSFQDPAGRIMLKRRGLISNERSWKDRDARIHFSLAED